MKREILGQAPKENCGKATEPCHSEPRPLIMLGQVQPPRTTQKFISQTTAEHPPNQTGNHLASIPRCNSLYKERHALDPISPPVHTQQHNTTPS